MRLYDLRNILMKNNSLEIKHTPEAQNFKLSNLLNVKTNLINLSLIPALENEINSIISTFNIIEFTADTTVVPGNIFSALNQYISSLKIKVTMFISILNSLDLAKDPLTVSIKYYDTKEIDQMIYVLGTYEKIIFRPMRLIGENIDLGNLDAGSRWTDFVFSTMVGFSLFTYILEKSLDIYTHKVQQVIVLNKLLETYFDLDQNIKTELETKKTNSINQKIQESPKFIIDKLNSKFPEEQENIKKLENGNDIKFAIEKQIELIEKGIEIFQALESPEEIKLSFPDMKKIIENSKIIKSIENK